MRPALVFCLLLIAPSLFAQETTTAPATDPFTFRVNAELVLIDALVENKKTGSLVGALEARDFLLSEDGVPQTITYFSQDQLPLSVVFLFDLTDTVRPVMPPLARGARQILAHLKPQDEVSIMTFSSSAAVLQRFTTNRIDASAAISEASAMVTDDGTFIHEDMYEAINQAMKSTIPHSRRVLVWLTDGTSNSQNAIAQRLIGTHGPDYLHSQEEATEKLLRSGVAVAALIEESDKTRVARMDSSRNSVVGSIFGDIERYAELTGGPVLHGGSKDIASQLANLIDQLRARYTLGYKPATPRPEGTFCKLQLQLNPDVRKEHPELEKATLVVRTTRGYYR